MLDMTSRKKADQSALLLREIEHIIAEAQKTGTIVRTARHAALLSASYPSAEVSVGKIADRLITSAVAAGVPIEVGRPDRPQAYGFILQPAKI
jgi:hypothetical protein